MAPFLSIPLFMISGSEFGVPGNLLLLKCRGIFYFLYELKNSFARILVLDAAMGLINDIYLTRIFYLFLSYLK